jgi:hypothetical protein
MCESDGATGTWLRSGWNFWIRDSSRTKSASSTSSGCIASQRARPRLLTSCACRWRPTTDVLGSIRVPTIVFHRSRFRDPARYVAERTLSAEVVCARDGAVHRPRGVDGERAAALGDRAWRDVLSSHHADVRRELARYRGDEVDAAGDGFFCRFDGPARAMACARAIVDGARGVSSTCAPVSTQASAS